jgi:hypothetical protein
MNEIRDALIKLKSNTTRLPFFYRYAEITFEKCDSELEDLRVKITSSLQHKTKKYSVESFYKTIVII